MNRAMRGNMQLGFALLIGFLLKVLFGDESYLVNLPMVVGATFVYFHGKTQSRHVNRWLMLAFLLRLTTGYVEELFDVLSLPGKHQNAEMFLRAAGSIYHMELLDALNVYDIGNYAWSFLIAALYFVLGESSSLVIWLNALLGTLVVYHSWSLARVVWPGSKAESYALYIMTLFPYQWALSGVELRDMLVIYVMMLSVVCFFKYVINAGILSFVAALCLSLVAMLLHGGVFIVIGVYCLFFFGKELHKILKGRLQNLTVMVVGSAIAVSLVVVALSYDVGIGKLYFLYESHERGDLSIVYSRMGDSNIAKSTNAYREPHHYSGIWDVLLDLVKYLPHFLLTPFIWELGHKLAFLNGTFYILAICIVGIGYRRLIRNGPALLLTIISSALLVVFAIGTTDYSTANRHKNKVVPLMAVVISGMLQSPKRMRVMTEKRSSGR